ncbi:hypothetical protein CDL15_Pgr020304 [Punica granatum]|uniref:Phosphate transporter n=1 Tax=Punica granatum TaxID=22663 RepID=A0A218Y357_PUNGR|nr:hypothetical protein CDL15_Pgr020304 [Punica granatum]
MFVSLQFFKEQQPSEGFLMWSMIVVIIVVIALAKRKSKYDTNKNDESLSSDVTVDSIQAVAGIYTEQVIVYDTAALIMHALAEKYDGLEDLFGFPHVLASCIFMLIQSASEVAALVSPFGAIHNVFTHRTKISGVGKDLKSIQVAWWFRAIGGLSAAMGFRLVRCRLTQSLGGKLTYMSNSRGLACQQSTIGAIVAVSLMKLPVSSVHAFVGSLVGVGLADNPQNVNWKLLLRFVFGWILTIVWCRGSRAVSVHEFGKLPPPCIVALRNAIWSCSRM